MTTTTSSGPLVKLLYMEFGKLFHHTAVVTRIGVGEFKKRKVHWIQLNETIFHPQGGGQPADQGTISKIHVIHVYKERSERIDQFEVSHFLDADADSPPPFQVGDKVELNVDEKARGLHARLHSGGHLLSDVVHRLIPNLAGFTGNHSPTDTYVKFKMGEDASYDTKEIVGRAQKECQILIDQKIPVTVTRSKDDLRAIQIGDNEPVPCGGTHVTNLEELVKLEVKGASVNKKEQTVTIKYTLSPL